MKVETDIHWYREADSTVCAKGYHKVKKNNLIQTVIIGPYFFDFCYRHAPFKDKREIKGQRE